ncbi:MAG: DUF3179 domain-containing protein [Candidatus Paceibacterota bacterium]
MNIKNQNIKQYTTYVIGGIIVIIGAILLFTTGPVSSEDNSSRSPLFGGGDILQTMNTTQHSIPLEEILGGGPAKDGIPSIDNPSFETPREATEWMDGDDIGLGLEYNGEERFYPYKILVWHEIVNDTVNGEPVLVTYCPLCATGVVFDSEVDGTAYEFGVSGKLWKSNLLMYNRTSDPEDESLWSQVLGEAVVGPLTGTELKIIPANTVKYEDWLSNHPNTQILSRDTGASRPYGNDPYGNYYTSDSVSFGATFNDDRLHPKDFVLGIEIDDQFKAYHKDALPIGTTVDSFAGSSVSITKDSFGEVRMTIGEEEIPFLQGFWFSWLSVHPETELFK